ncbi:hypothetical protein [Haloarchaeobius sp. DFWS5]
MATNSAHPTTLVETDAEPEEPRRVRGGVGMAHVTVVPTNFERHTADEE